MLETKFFEQVNVKTQKLMKQFTLNLARIHPMIFCKKHLTFKNS